MYDNKESLEKITFRHCLNFITVRIDFWVDAFSSPYHRVIGQIRTYTCKRVHLVSKSSKYIGGGKDYVLSKYNEKQNKPIMFI